MVPVPKSAEKILTAVGNRSDVDTKYDLADVVNEVLLGSLVNLRVVALDVEIIVVVSTDVGELVRLLGGLLGDGLLDDGLLDDDFFIVTVDLRKPGELKPGKGGDSVPVAMFRRL